MAIGLEQFEKAVKGLLDEYGAEVVHAVQDVVPDVGKEAAKKLRAESPRKTGKYRKGWTSQSNVTRTGAEATVYGKSGTYQLAHLLENGHAKRGGGRTKAIVHIKPVEEWAANEVEDRITRKLS
jgi:hypothetical protein